VARVLIVRPPKYLWPYINEQDNYLLPQAIVYLGAALRQAGHEVHLLDCMPLRLGWPSLERTIRDLRPQIVCAGESETLYQHESGRVFALAKQIDPTILTVAGGVHFSHAAAHALANYPLDVIVRGEGELTIAALADAWDGDRDLTKVAGLILRGAAGEPVYTAPRPLIEDLDTLPFPAYDLLPMHRYGTARYLFSPGGVTMHHSRGCVSNCTFCACWLQFAEENGRTLSMPRPRWRTRSVEPVVDEMETLHRRYGKSCIVFVDDTWNVDPKWEDRFADELLRRRLELNWFAFMRADFLYRDEQSGLFAKLLRAGLAHICVGMERADDDELNAMEKHNVQIARSTELIRRMRKQYPQLFLQTTFIVGLRHETQASLDRLLAYVESIDPDYPAFHPLTPVPGTAMFEQAQREGWLEITDFARYDWMTPVMRTETMSRDELEMALWRMNSKYMRPWRVLRGLFTHHTYRRRMYLWWLKVSLSIGLDYLLDRVLPSRSQRRKAQLSDYVGMIKPSWYDR